MKNVRNTYLFRHYATQNSATALHLHSRTVATFTLLHHFIGYHRVITAITSYSGLHLSCNGTRRAYGTPSRLPRHQLPRCLSALTSYGNRPNTTYVSSDSFAVHTTSRRRESWCGGYCQDEKSWDFEASHGGLARHAPRGHGPKAHPFG